MTCTEINATTRHYARTVGDYLPCGHTAVRAADSSLECGARIRCAHCKGRHETVAQVRDCAHWEQVAEAEYDADAAYERFLENGGVHADRIAWEIAEDDRRAAAFGFPI